MAKRTNRDAQRRELVRLLKGLEYYRSWRISALERDKGVVIEDDLNKIVMPSSFFLKPYDETKGSAGSAVIKEVRQWYSHTASDLFSLIKSGDKARASDAKKFLKDFQSEVGFDFIAEAGFYEEMTFKALKQGRITSPEIYHSLKELENDLSQSNIGSEELIKISELLRDFEDRVKVRQ